MRMPQSFYLILTGHLVLVWEDGQRSEMRKTEILKKTQSKESRVGAGGDVQVPSCAAPTPQHLQTWPGLPQPAALACPHPSVLSVITDTR